MALDDDLFITDRTGLIGFPATIQAANATRTYRNENAGMLSHRTMKPVGRCCEQCIADGNLNRFAARQIFRCNAHTVHLLKKQFHENMEAKS